jgi:hypothetical protein
LAAVTRRYVEKAFLDNCIPKSKFSRLPDHHLVLHSKSFACRKGFCSPEADGLSKGAIEAKYDTGAKGTIL